MRINKKIKLIGIISIVCCLFILLCFLPGCSNNRTVETELIPNGIYGASGTENHYVLSKGNGGEHYWKIKGNKAERHTSGFTDYKCNIIEENGEIFFEGYTWKTTSSSKENGIIFKCRVNYNEDLQSITIFWE